VNGMTKGKTDMDTQDPKTAASASAAPVSPLDETGLPQEGPSTAAEAALDVPMAVQVIVGQAQMTVRDVMAIRRGQLVELDRKASDLVDVTVNGKVLAKGELTVFDDGRIGVSLVEIVRGRA